MIVVHQKSSKKKLFLLYLTKANLRFKIKKKKFKNTQIIFDFFLNKF